MTWRSAAEQSGRATPLRSSRPQTRARTFRNRYLANPTVTRVRYQQVRAPRTLRRSM
jgi:hypothetical protein